MYFENIGMRRVDTLFLMKKDMRAEKWCSVAVFCDG